MQSALETRSYLLQVAFELLGIVGMCFVCFVCVEWNAAMPNMIFLILLLLMMLALVAFMFRLFQCDLVFYYWALWSLWALYGFGFYESEFYLRTELLVLLYALFTSLVHLISLVSLSLNRVDISGQRLAALFLLALFVDVVPLTYNNLFVGATSHPYLRTFLATMVSFFRDGKLRL